MQQLLDDGVQGGTHQLLHLFDDLHTARETHPRCLKVQVDVDKETPTQDSYCEVDDGVQGGTIKPLRLRMR